MVTCNTSKLHLSHIIPGGGVWLCGPNANVAASEASRGAGRRRRATTVETRRHVPPFSWQGEEEMVHEMTSRWGGNVEEGAKRWEAGPRNVAKEQEPFEAIALHPGLPSAQVSVSPGNCSLIGRRTCLRLLVATEALLIQSSTAYHGGLNLSATQSPRQFPFGRAVTSSVSGISRPTVYPFFESDTLFLECCVCVAFNCLALLRIEGCLYATL